MYRFKQLILIAGDTLIFYSGLFLALYLRSGKIVANPNLPEIISSVGLLYVVGVFILYIFGLYDIGRMKPTISLYKKISLSALIWIIAGVVYFYVNPYLRITPKTTLVLNAVISFALIGLWRILQNTLFGTSAWKMNIVFAGYTPEVQEIITCIQHEPGRGYEVLGIITNQSVSVPSKLPTVTPTQLETVFPNTIDVIVLGPEFSTNADFIKILYDHLFKKVDIITLAELYETFFGRIPPFIFSEDWFLTNLREQQKRIYDRFRILSDYAIAILIGLFFLITFPIIALLIRTSSKGPIFFRQTRIGRLGKVFTMYKYRTMRALTSDGSAEPFGPQFATTNDTRITSIGKLLRRTRLDELPQCVNILKGEMALIGPRPERPEFVAKLNETMPFYALRHLIKPGLTGWAQLQESYYGTIAENLRKLEFDLYYIKNRGVLLDLAILLRTIPVIARMIGR